MLRVIILKDSCSENNFLFRKLPLIYSTAVLNISECRFNNCSINYSSIWYKSVTDYECSFYLYFWFFQYCVVRNLISSNDSNSTIRVRYISCANSIIQRDIFLFSSTLRFNDCFLHFCDGRYGKIPRWSSIR